MRNPPPGKEALLVTIFLRTGQEVVLDAGETLTMTNRLGGQETNTVVLSCKDAGGKTIAEFISDAIAGYVIGERPSLRAY